MGWRAYILTPHDDAMKKAILPFHGWKICSAERLSSFTNTTVLTRGNAICPHFPDSRASGPNYYATLPCSLILLNRNIFLLLNKNIYSLLKGGFLSKEIFNLLEGADVQRPESKDKREQACCLQVYLGRTWVLNKFVLNEHHWWGK